jgi:hypothetical protein
MLHIVPANPKIYTHEPRSNAITEVKTHKTNVDEATQELVLMKL